MRERARDKGRLEDIVEYSNNVVMLVEGYTFEALVSDKRTYYSVIAVGTWGIVAVIPKYLSLRLRLCIHLRNNN